MPALIAITEDVGAREALCAVCGEVIGIVDFLVRCSPRSHNGKFLVHVEYVHLECDPDVKRHVQELRATKHELQAVSSERIHKLADKVMSERKQ